MSRANSPADLVARRRDDAGGDIEALARLMDDAVTIPGQRVRVGLDALLGLIPGGRCRRRPGVALYSCGRTPARGPRSTSTRMALNVAVDALIGALPVLGDVFDVFFRANRRNVELLRRSIGASPEDYRRHERRDRWYVAFLLIGLAALVVGCLVVAYILLAWLLNSIYRIF
jgi:hypothetical protein